MKKFFALFLALALAFSPICFAADVDVQDGGTDQGRARTLNFGDGIVATVSGGVASISAAAAAITSGTITGVTTISGVSVIATQYLRMLYVASTNLRPASGAPAGSMIQLGQVASANDCGVASFGTNVYAVCISNGTDWKAI